MKILFLLFISISLFGQSNLTVKNLSATGNVIATGAIVGSSVRNNISSDSILITKVAAGKLVNGYSVFPYSVATLSNDLITIGTNEQTVNSITTNNANQNYIGTNNFYQNSIDVNNKGQNYIANNYGFGSLINNKQNSSTALKSIGVTIGDSLRVGGGNTAIQLFTAGVKTFELDRLGAISCKSITATDGNIFNNIGNTTEQNAITVNIENSYAEGDVEQNGIVFNNASTDSPTTAIKINNSGENAIGLNLIMNAGNNSKGIYLLNNNSIGGLNDNGIFIQDNTSNQNYTHIKIYNLSTKLFEVNHKGQIFANSFQTDTTATAQSPNKKGLIWYGNGSTITNGAIGATIKEIAASSTLDNSHNVILANSASAITLTLPTAASSQYRMYKIKSINTGDVTIDANGTETIDGDLIIVLSQYDAITIISNGTNWFIL